MLKKKNFNKKIEEKLKKIVHEMCSFQFRLGRVIQREGEFGLFERTMAWNTSVRVARFGCEHCPPHGIRFIEIDGPRRQALFDWRVSQRGWDDAKVGKGGDRERVLLEKISRLHLSALQDQRKRLRLILER